MREWLRSILRLSWAMSVLVWKELGNFFSSNSSLHPELSVHPNNASSVDDSTAQAPPGNNFNSTQNGRKNLNFSRLIVLGEGLAAGVSDFSLNSESQPWSFPAQLARQLGTALPLPLIQPPGIGDFVGFPQLTVRIPAPLQTTVLSELPPRPVSNLAVPGFRLQDALSVRALQPLIHRHDAKQTAANLIWGTLAIAQGKTSTPTQLEYAVEQSPTFTIVELGYYEALEAAVSGDRRRLPDTREFAAHYSRILGALKETGSEILVLNIPDPFNTAHFSSLEIAARIAMVEPSLLREQYGLHPDDLITLNGLNEIGFQIFGKSLEMLPPGSSVSSEFAAAIRERINDLNRAIAGLAAKYEAIVYDLADLFGRLAHHGYAVGARTLTREYLGGFFALNGYYPGRTGQGIIANEILSLLNRFDSSAFPLIDLNNVIGSDPVAAYQQAGGPSWSSDQLRQLSPRKPGLALAEVVKPSRRSYGSNGDWTPFDSEPAAKLPLQLPNGLEQVLPLSKSASYFGDGISALNSQDPRGIQWGATANWLFGGLAMVDSHLTGAIRIKFTAPVNNVTQFQLDYMEGLIGEDSVLLAPQFFKMPFQQNRVDDVSGNVSSGTLNLATGEVSNLTVYARYSSTALQSLVEINPTFPRQPLSFPGQYGSAWAKFEPRPDGKLDFSFYGSSFVPLGKDIIWPLNFVGPSGQFASIPAAGTVMHPHLSLSTREPEAVSTHSCPDVPFNTLQEYTLFTHNSAFGDAFSLNVPDLGGPAKGRSHILGRLQIQFGGRCGNTVPFAVWGLPPGGIMAPLNPSPISEVFPGRLSAGPQGFNENLRFPLRSYPLDDLSIIDDPFDISIGAIDLKTGRCLNGLLHRAFISQDLIFALLRVEPRTPKDSFFFRGPALLTSNWRNQSVFRFQGIVHVPYPAGFKFPHPDFATAFTVGSNSALDPFLWFHAIQADTTHELLKEGGAQHVRSSTGDEFSYRYSIQLNTKDAGAFFEYENHSQQGKFKMHSLAWADFCNSGASTDTDRWDTVTFSGFGIWSKDGVNTVQQVAVQISTSAEKPYIGIQVAAGDVSNVNTKPIHEPSALP